LGKAASAILVLLEKQGIAENVRYEELSALVKDRHCGRRELARFRSACYGVEDAVGVNDTTVDAMVRDLLHLRARRYVKSLARGLLRPASTSGDSAAGHEQKEGEQCESEKACGGGHSENDQSVVILTSTVPHRTVEADEIETTNGETQTGLPAREAEAKKAGALSERLTQTDEIEDKNEEAQADPPKQQRNVATQVSFTATSADIASLVKVVDTLRRSLEAEREAARDREQQLQRTIRDLKTEVRTLSSTVEKIGSEACLWRRSEARPAPEIICSPRRSMISAPASARLRQRCVLRHLRPPKPIKACTKNGHSHMKTMNSRLIKNPVSRRRRPHLQLCRWLR